MLITLTPIPLPLRSPCPLTSTCGCPPGVFMCACAFVRSCGPPMRVVPQAAERLGKFTNQSRIHADTRVSLINEMLKGVPVALRGGGGGVPGGACALPRALVVPVLACARVSASGGPHQRVPLLCAQAYL